MLKGSVGERRSRYTRKNVRVTYNAVKKDAMIPMTRVTAKPRIGPVPNWYRIAAVISVGSSAIPSETSSFPVCLPP